MLLVIRNLCIFKMVTDTNIKQLENSMETHKAYLEMFNLQFSSCFMFVSVTVLKIL
jgi:hypothetical protein